jgi:hypothetical protein
LGPSNPIIEKYCHIFFVNLEIFCYFLAKKKADSN